MGTATVIVSFIVCFIFNIFLNSFDVYSDTALAYNALTFNLGSSILLSGCRVCHGKDDKDEDKDDNGDNDGASNINSIEEVVQKYFQLLNMSFITPFFVATFLVNITQIRGHFVASH